VICTLNNKVSKTGFSQWCHRRTFFLRVWFSKITHPLLIRAQRVCWPCWTLSKFAETRVIMLFATGFQGCTHCNKTKHTCITLCLLSDGWWWIILNISFSLIGYNVVGSLFVLILMWNHLIKFKINKITCI